ncbi:MAG TPA: hypothetical protein VMW26_04805 [Methanomassiliicoccales archaeon]|nr:hypothetical protein [Methanomassiliicoccales archaeon]
MLGSKIPRRGHGEARPLIPRIHGEVGSYSDRQFRAIKRKIREEAGIPFKFKDFRPTFTQMTLDRNPNLLSDVAKQLGHKTTRTIELYYGRISDEKTFQRLDATWDSMYEEFDGDIEN